MPDVIRYPVGPFAPVDALSAGQRGETLEEARPAIDNRLHARLLEHHLGDPDRVWVVGAAPREIALVFVVPTKKSATRRANRTGLEVHPREHTGWCLRVVEDGNGSAC